MEDRTDWEEEISLFDLVTILLRRKWLIAGVTLATFILALLAWRFVPQTFKAEFQVTFAESSFPGEFKGQISVRYYGSQEPLNIPYSFSAPLREEDSPDLLLASFAKAGKILEISRTNDFEALVERYGLSVNRTLQEGGGVLFTVASRSQELCRKMAEVLALQVQRDLLSALQERHNAKIAFFQDLVRVSAERYEEAKEKLFAFLERNDLFALDARVKEVEESLAVLKERRKILQQQQDAPVLSLPLSPEVLRELSFVSLEKALSVGEGLRERYEKAIQEIDEEIRALQKEKEALEMQKLRQSPLVDEYNLLLRDYTFWRELQRILSLSLPPYEAVGARAFDGKVMVGDIKYSGNKRSLKLNLAVGVVAGLFVGVFAAFFVEFWERAKAQTQKGTGNP
ncbi:Wzz/FepE/Etk N-terminal domain-containing protein [Candidatus Caldatribacterium sp. SIUC1]|uniref:Wzz/FepE/Etk N-terminal domain-containing protein n=1 Tax=Candidatus Caldatribacterium sp. SIUC1 TaxID=3418365 RepID=UPI003F693B3A